MFGVFKKENLLKTLFGGVVQDTPIIKINFYKFLFIFLIRDLVCLIMKKKTFTIPPLYSFFNKNIFSASWSAHKTYCVQKKIHTEIIILFLNWFFFS